MATTKRKTAPAKVPARIEVTPRGKEAISDFRRATDAELAEGLKVAAKAYNAALNAVIKAGLEVKAFVEHFGDAANDDTPQSAAAITPPTVQLIAIDRKHLS